MEAESGLSVLEGADGLEEGLLVGLADAHDLSDGAHLGSEDVLDALEFLEGPAGEFDDDVVAGGCVAVEGAVAPVGEFAEGDAGGEECGDVGDGEAGGLGGERGGA